MADPTEQSAPTITDGRTVIQVAPEQVYQKDPNPKQFWELSFVGHVVSVVAISCVIVFGVLAAAGMALAAFTDAFD